MGNTTSILPPEAQTSAHVRVLSERLRSNRSSLASRLAHAPPSPLFPSPTGNNSLLGLARFARHPVMAPRGASSQNTWQNAISTSSRCLLFFRSAGLHRLSHWRVGHSSFSYMHSGAQRRRDDWLQPVQTLSSIAPLRRFLPFGTKQVLVQSNEGQATAVDDFCRG